MDEAKRRISPAVLAGDGALLLCAMMGLTGCFLTLYTGPEVFEWADVSVLERCAGGQTLFLTCAALFALLSLAAWSLPRFRGAAAGGLAVLCGLVVWRQWDEVMSGAVFTCKAVSDLFAARVDWGRTFSYESSMGLIRAAAHTRLFLLLCLAALALALGWAVVRARRWWLVLALTLPPLLPGLLADFYPDWPPFLALSACWCAMMLTDLCRWAAPSGRGRLTLTALPAAAAALALIMTVFPQEGYSRPSWALEAEAALHNAASGASDFFSRWEGPFQGPGVTYVGSAGEENLAGAGPLRYSGRTVLRVSGDYSGRMYLRGSSLAVYEDGVWKALPEGTYEEYSSADAPSVCPLYFPALFVEDGFPTHAMTVDNVGAVGSCVYAPYFPLPQDVDETGILPVEDSYLARRRGQQSFTMTFAERELQVEDGTTQVVVGVGDGATYLGRTDVGAARTRYANFVYDHYLAVPNELRPALAQFCETYQINSPYQEADALMEQLADTDPNDRDAAQVILGEIAQLMADNDRSPLTPVWAARDLAALLDWVCEYDPETPAAPAGTDPVLYFLNDSHRGYCMHYASAAALLLRELGIPARYVGGFTADCRAGEQVDVPDRAAHAWVEVWVNGFGWYPVEVTPAAAFDWYEEGTVPGEAPSDTPPEESEDPEPTPTPEPEDTSPPSLRPEEVPTPGGIQGGGFQVPVKLLKTLGGIAGIAALLWLGQFLLKRRRAARMSGPDPNKAALACYNYLVSLERWGAKAVPRARELAEKAKFSRHTLTQAELDELRLLVDWERRRLCAMLPPAKLMLFGYLWGMPPDSKKRKNAEKSGQDGD